MDKQVVLFVYEHKETGEISVKYLEEISHFMSNESDWNHIGTLEPKHYIQSLLREYSALVRRLKGDTA
jgi:hypothetical protein